MPHRATWSLTRCAALLMVAAASACSPDRGAAGPPGKGAARPTAPLAQTRAPAALPVVPWTAVTPGAEPATFTVRGRVLFQGDVPPRYRPRAASGAAAGTAAGEVAAPPPAIVDAEGGVRDVVVALESPAAAAALAGAAGREVEIDQAGSVFAPHVAALPAGGRVRFRNSDAIPHGVQIVERGFTVETRNLAAGGEWLFQPPARAGDYTIGCGMHAWMSAFVRVTSTPFCAVSGEEGAFAIAGVPAGAYDVTLRHLHLKAATPAPGRITLPKGADRPLTLTVRR
ncbi:MAG: hypothetical protein HY719_12785 [Planctomycetes bacterium]|nr:hypothetical protein [Planctomycetota bacterium]